MTRRYLATRLGSAVLTLFGVAVVVFVVLRALPGSAITAKVGTSTGLLTEAQLRSLEHYYGLDQPPPVQFFTWLGSVLHGNLGISVDSGNSVASLVADAAPVTVELAVLATIIGSAVGVLLGVVAASQPHGVRDISMQSFGLLGLALPEFVTASVLVTALAVTFGYFPSPGTYVSLTESVSGNLSQMIYPALVLSVGIAATVMRTTRSAYREVAHADFVRTARGKGLRPIRVRLRHILQNASIPIVTIVGIQFGYLLGGTIIVEQIFALPGLGRLLFTSIVQRDYPVVQSTVLLIAVAFVLVNLIVDLLYKAIDPRARAA